jgi:hypothetical protein
LIDHSECVDRFPLPLETPQELRNLVDFACFFTNSSEPGQQWCERIHLRHTTSAGGFALFHIP